MGGKSSKQVSGYKYSLSMHMGLCRGPVNAITQISVGDKVVWPTRENWIDEGQVSDNNTFIIDTPDVFGGDSGEGGIAGTVYPLFGRVTQTIGGFIQGLLSAVGGDGRVPQFRGVLTLFYDGQVCSNNPYPKPWKIRVFRNTEGWQNDAPWYAEKAEIPMRGSFTGELDFHGGVPLVGQTLTINGYVMTYVGGIGALGPKQIRIGTDNAATAQATYNYIAVYAGTIGVTATLDDELVTLVTINPAASLTIAISGMFPQIHGGTESGRPLIHAMNPAHILYECTTNTVWGRGIDPSKLDSDSFKECADKLSDEGFGLCMKWARSDAITQFMAQVINHIGGAIYVDRTTGLITMRLIRNDYDPNSLPVFTYGNGLLSIEGDDANASDTNYNEIIVNWHDPIMNQDRQARVHNLAGIQATGNLISNTTDYKGLPTADLALRVAERDLTISANWLKKLKITLDRRGWKIAPTSAFIIRAPDRGIEQMILRASEIEDGTLKDGKIVVTALQDVFGLPATSFVGVQGQVWFRPDRSALPVLTRLETEASYRDLFLNASAGDFAQISPTDCALMVFAQKPTSLSQSFELLSGTDGTDFNDTGAAHFTPSGTLVVAIGYYDTLIQLTEGVDLAIATVPGGCQIDDEVCQITSLDPTTGVATITRGCQDTLPVPHAANSVVWIYDQGNSTDNVVYTGGETVYTKLLTRTSSDLLAPSRAPIDATLMRQRFYRPYPPGNLTINTAPFGNYVDRAVVLGVVGVVFAWAHRDRLIEQDVLFPHQTTDIGPEAGTTYNVRVYQVGVLIRTVTGLTANNWTYTRAMWNADGAVRETEFQIESERDGIVSWQIYDFAIKIYGGAGFDYDFDNNFDSNTYGFDNAFDLLFDE